MMPAIISMLTSRAGLGALGMLALLAFLGWGAVSMRDSATDQCNQAHAAAQAKAAAADHAEYLAAVAWGNQISAQLAQTQRRLDATKSEYLAYAGAITGVCDPSIGLLVEHASGAKAGMPEAARPPADGSIAKSPADIAYEEAVARAMGQNIAENYSRLDKCIAEKRAINEWHSRPKKDLAHE